MHNSLIAQPLGEARNIKGSSMKISQIVLTFSMSFASHVVAGGLILNEYNGVGSTKYLTEVIGDTDKGVDSYFGRVLGNGGNWVEFIVTQDHLDLRGYKLLWAETLNTATDGTDQWYGNGAVEQGIITFSNNAVWSDMRAGTILTVCEFDASNSAGGKNDDFTFDPCNGDWWINAHTFNNPTYFTTTTNKTLDVPGNFSTGNNGWLMEIRDKNDNLVTAGCGEGGSLYGGSGVSSTEVGKLEAQASADITNASYDDGDNSSFGSPNSWKDAIFVTCKVHQDFATMRAPVLEECASCTPIFLNEYNAVISTGYLNGGTATVDANGGASVDTHFGRVLGNGGNWMELVVVIDNLDLRGWTLSWREVVVGGTSGTITFGDASGLAAIPSGTILTIIDRNAAAGGMNTDLTVNISGGDRWMNIYSGDTNVIAATTSTKPGAGFGSFSTSNDEWELTIKDASATVVAGPFGEGSVGYFLGSVGSDDVCRLEENPSTHISQVSDFDDTARFSTFGAPNQWAQCPDDSVVISQDFSALGDGVCQISVPCFGDIDGSGEVDSGDVSLTLLEAGPCDACPADLDGSGEVDSGDVSLVLLSTGPCQ
jgi:hypothetical protein